MDTIHLIKYLISINYDLIEKTAISNCHAIGLNSFIINEKPRMRLFVADPFCELYKEFDYKNPIIPIHPHKYDDLFTQIEGKLVNHMYKVGNDIEFNKYEYLRLSDKSSELINLGKENLTYLGSNSNVTILKASELHTANISGDKCSWIITETFEDKNFKQAAYHQNLVKNPELYKEFENPIGYLEQYFNINKIKNEKTI